MKTKRILGITLMFVLLFNFIMPTATIAYATQSKVYHAQVEGIDEISIETINHGNPNPSVWKDLYLPSTLPSDSNVAVTWTSDNENLVVEDETGRVTLYEDRQSEVTLTASIIENGIEICKTFDLVLEYEDVPEAPKTPEGDEVLLFYENFDGETLNGSFTLTGNSSQGNTEVVKEEVDGVVDGKLRFTRTSAGGTTNHNGFNYYFGNNFTGDRVVLEYEVERESPKVVFINNFDNNSNKLVDIRLQPSCISAYNGAAVHTIVRPNFTKTTKIKVIVEHNFTNQTYSMWVDGEKVITDFSFRASGQKLNGMYVYTEGDNFNTVYFDNFKIYHSVPKMKEAVDINMNSIEKTGLEAIMSEVEGEHAVSFGYNTEYDCNVTFISEKNLINADGSVNYPEFATDDVVTVTVSKGDYSRSVSYPVTIAGTFNAGEFQFENETPVAGDNYMYIEAFSRTDATLDVAVIMAAYEKNELKAINIVPNTIIPKSDEEYANMLEGFITLDEVTETTTIKAFLFESLDNIRPLK